MGKQSDAKRRAKLKARRKRAEASEVLAAASQSRIAREIAALDAEPNIIAELVGENDALLADVEGEDDQWTLVVDDNPAGGSSDEFVALGMFLRVAVDAQASGAPCFIQLSPWLLDAVQERCDALDIDWLEFLHSLLPPEQRAMALPQHRLM